MTWVWLALPAASVWIALLLLPWRPGSTRESLDAPAGRAGEDLSDVTVLIPARNEAGVLPATLAALGAQGSGLRVVVVDDQSGDGTAEAARAAALPDLEVVVGEPLPEGWTGKVWALEQGLRRVRSPLILLLDADIALAPGTVGSLRRKLREGGYQLVSLMAWLRMDSAWERLLLPAFVYFFKLLYPFGLSNDPSVRRVAAAAGGCVLLEARALGAVGGMAAIRDAIIDDCSLARRFKDAGLRTWIGLTRSARSLRAYEHLAPIWRMVARSAYTQLGYSPLVLGAATALMLALYVLPLLVLVVGEPAGRALAALALLGMITGYLPVVRYYRLSPGWALTLPAAAMLFLAMTWHSAWRYWRGVRSTWKQRVYAGG